MDSFDRNSSEDREKGIEKANKLFESLEKLRYSNFGTVEGKTLLAVMEQKGVNEELLRELRDKLRNLKPF